MIFNNLSNGGDVSDADENERMTMFNKVDGDDKFLMLVEMIVESVKLTDKGVTTLNIVALVKVIFFNIDESSNDDNDGNVNNYNDSQSNDNNNDKDFLLMFACGIELTGHWLQLMYKKMRTVSRDLKNGAAYCHS